MTITVATGALFAVSTAAALAWFGPPFLEERGATKLRHLPGELSDGHAQLALACDRCHTPFGGVRNEACLGCHEAGLAAGEDAHPESKFTDPRNADRLALLDARRCVTCHAEHVPEKTSRGGVTLAAGFCERCHADIAKERPSHRGEAFTSCASAGCHNFHDNRALNEDFLAKHLDEPRLRHPATVAARVAAGAAIAAPDAPAGVDDAVDDEVIRAAWNGSAHRGAGVTCASCHAPDGQPWQQRPGWATCRACHEGPAAGFDGGKHGMRAAAGLAAMTPAAARRPMRKDALDEELGCGSCHGAHDVDTRKAAVEACLGCHDDEHSRAYPGGPHDVAWRAELRGEAPSGSGVSCATCHLPRVAGPHGVRVEHDQNANLRPVTKMVRTVCLGCHGAGASLDALADAALTARNFDRAPAVHLRTLDWVRDRRRQRAGKEPR